MTLRPVLALRRELVLIGPVCVGKTSVATALAARLGVPHVELDELSGDYYRRAGFDSDRAAAIEQADGYVARYRYRETVFPASLHMLFEEHRDCVFDLGAGHTCLLDPSLAGQVQAQLVAFANVILLLPSADPERSVAVIRERLRGDPERAGHDWVQDGVDFIRHWVTADQNRTLATHFVVTGERSPEQVADEILELTSDR